MTALDLRTKIREVADFPTPGVGFKDFTPLLADAEALSQTISGLGEWVRSKEPDVVLGAEARGFILGAAIATNAGVGFVPARRPGKLPPETVSATYMQRRFSEFRTCVWVGPGTATWRRNGDDGH